MNYRRIYNIRCTKWQNLNNSHPVLQFAQSIETRCQVDNEDVVGAAPTGDLGDQQSYCLLWCLLYWRVDGNHFQTHIKDRYVLWNCPHVNATRPQWWLVSIGSGNGLTPSSITWANINIDLGRHWFMYWLVAWWHQAITWTNVDLSSKIFILSKISLKSPRGQWVDMESIRHHDMWKQYHICIYILCILYLVYITRGPSQ